LIGDFIKNKKRDHLSEGIQQGITLHRAIDAFTDVTQSFRSENRFSNRL
jgi:acyl carrier protein phosphodiesterase